MLYRKKIYILIFSLLVAGGLLFGYGFGLLDQSNAGLADQILVQKKTLLELQAEQTSFEQSKRALDDLLSKPYQPENFFSNDINLVHEIKTIEAISSALQVEAQLRVSGVVKLAPKAPTVSEVFLIPFSLQVTGHFAEVVQFIEKLEHESFPISTSSISVSNQLKGLIGISMTGNLYVKK